MRDCLIIVRAGDDSLHPGWLGDNAERTFDVMVSYYGVQPDRFRAGVEHYHAAPGPRWPAHNEICRQHWDILSRYEYIAFACDDLDAPPATWNRLFAICRQRQLDLAQPAIDGPVSHAITTRHPGCLYRLTNFVEIMCPVFRRPILDDLRWTLAESESGWGLDYLWSQLLPYPRFKLAIVDAAPVRHVRPPGQGSLQAALQQRGIVKQVERDSVLRKHHIEAFPHRNYACVAAPPPSQTAVIALYNSLTDAQRREICFDWDHCDSRRGLVRAFLANHWQVTSPAIRGNFFTSAQQHLIHDIFQGLLKPHWYPKFLKQLRDDTQGHPWGTDQSIALFGTPGAGPCQLLITGRHLTLRADAYAEGRTAFGGPILYGHAASGYHEKPDHPGNIFWPQAQAASSIYAVLSGQQRQRALLPRMPAETDLRFQGPHGRFPGIPVAELATDQKVVLRQALEALLEPFHSRERILIQGCLGHQGGLDRCSLAFYQENQISTNAWDSWRIEGPAFLWYFRGVPHVHVWVHIAPDASAPIHAKTGTFIHAGQNPLR